MSTPAQRALNKSKKANPAADVAPETKAPPHAETAWETTKISDVTVVLRGKAGKEKLTVIRRSKGPDGRYLSPKTDPGGMFMLDSPAMRLSSKSAIAGEGNLGIKHGDFIPHRGNCNYSCGLAIGGVRPGDTDVDKEIQRAFIKKVYDISVRLMGDLFDLNPQKFKLPIDNAYLAARRENYKNYKNADGSVLKDIGELQALEQADKAVRTEIHAAAKAIFIEKAKPLPGSSKPGDDGVVREPMVWARKKVWAFENFNAERDGMSKETGPDYGLYPSSYETWMDVHAQMTDPAGKLHRKYQSVIYADARTGKPFPRPPKKVPKKKFDPKTNKEVVEEVVIPDPFYNPCMEDDNGDPLNALVATRLLFSVFRGAPTSGDNYGVHVNIAAALSVCARTKRDPNTVIIPTAVGFALPVEEMPLDDNDDEDDVDDDEVDHAQHAPVDADGLPGAAGLTQAPKIVDDAGTAVNEVSADQMLEDAAHAKRKAVSAVTEADVDASKRRKVGTTVADTEPATARGGKKGRVSTGRNVVPRINDDDSEPAGFNAD